MKSVHSPEVIMRCSLHDKLSFLLCLPLVLAACGPERAYDLQAKPDSKSQALQLGGGPFEVENVDLALATDGSIVLAWTEPGSRVFHTGRVVDGEVVIEYTRTTDFQFGSPGVAFTDDLLFMVGEEGPQDPYSSTLNRWRMLTNIPNSTRLWTSILFGTSVRPEMTRNDGEVTASWTAWRYRDDEASLYMLNTAHLRASTDWGSFTTFSACSNGPSKSYIRNDQDPYTETLVLSRFYGDPDRAFIHDAPGQVAIECHADGPRALIRGGLEEVILSSDQPPERRETGLPVDGLGVADVHTADGVDWVLRRDDMYAEHVLYRRVDGGDWERIGLPDMPAGSDVSLDTRGEQALLFYTTDGTLHWTLVQDGSQPAGGDLNATSVALSASTPEVVLEAVLQPGEMDVYTITVPEGLGAVELHASTSSATDTMGALFDEAGQLLAENDDLDPWVSYDFGLDHTVEPGTYTLEVTGYAASTEGPYTLTLTAVPL